MYFLRRILSAIFTIFILTIFLFLMLQVIPGDPVLSKLGADEMEMNPELEALLRDKFELDKPIIVRYTNWLKRSLKGDLGDIFNILSQIGLALPGFWLAILLLGIFGAKLGWFPIRGRIDLNNILYSLRSLVLPVLSLSIGGIASVARYLKTAIIQQEDKDYVLVAQSKGLEDKEIFKLHILKNSLIPVTTIIGLIFIGLMTGSILVENVFSLTGIGNLLITAINSSDYPVIQGMVLYYSFIVVFVSLILYIVYVIIDPRIKLDKVGD